ncbi:MAG: (Fe-S)-binding protein, partial [Pseudomonadota bacterium]
MRPASDITLVARAATRATSSDLAAALSNAVRLALAPCTGCGLCNAVRPAANNATAVTNRGLIAMLWHVFARADLSNSEQAPSAAALIELGPHLDRVLETNQVDAICPEGVRFGDAVRAARAVRMIACDGDRNSRAYRQLGERFMGTRHTGRLSKLKAAARPFTGGSRPPSVANLAEADEDGRDDTRGEVAAFARPGVALTERAEQRGRVVLLPGSRDRHVRPHITEATLRLLARQGFDVVVPPGHACSGAVGDALGMAEAAATCRAQNIRAIEHAQVVLERAVPERDVTPRLDALVTTGPVDAVAVRRTVQRHPTPFVLPPIDLDTRRLIEGASDAISFLADRDFGAPTRWSALRVGVLRSDGRDVVASRDLANLLENAGYTANVCDVDGTWLQTSGLQTWTTPDSVAAVRAQTFAALARARLDVLAVADVGALVLLGETPPLPVVHAVELLDW